jgi:protein-tyrosine phosphatase
VKRILFVCAGNICRSPMAEGIFRKLVQDQKLEHQFEIDSAGTGNWHEGEPAHPRTVKMLELHGAGFKHAARQVRPSDSSFDLILAADKHNLANLTHMLPNTQHKTQLMLKKAEVPDPYYGSLEDYQNVYNMLLPALEKLLEELKLELQIR